MQRRTFLTTTGAAVASLPWLPGCGGGGGGDSTATNPPVVPAGSHAVTLAVNAASPGIAVNRRVLGSNVEWVDNGDNLLDAATGGFDATTLALVKAIAPTSLRYPGGLQADVFHWEQPNNEHVFTRAVQPTRMNTQRLLELCEATGALPLFTVNVITGTPDEAARWVRATNITRLVSSATGALLPTVDFWEIGNEPYLQADSRPDLDIAPAEFARRASLFIRAMRAVDPTISIGLPLTLDRRNGLPITAYSGYARTVLGALTETFDVACVHNAYMPLVFGGTLDVAALTPGALAAAEAVRDDLAATRALLAELRPGAAIPIAVTEHAPLFSLGEGATDDWSTTPLGAIYLADLLRVFAETDDVIVANHWSLSGNGRFGAIGGNGRTAFNRTVADVLLLAGQAVRGNRLVANLACETVATPSVGLVAARSALPLCSALVTREGSSLRTLLIHKDATRNAQVQFDLSGASASSARLTTLSAADLTNAADLPALWQRATLAPAGGTRLTLNLPPHSVALLELAL